MPVRFIARTSSEPASLTSCNSFPISRLAGLVLATALLLTGCGGGGSSGDAGGSTPHPTTFSVSTNTSGSGTGSISPSSANVGPGSTAVFNITPASSSSLSDVTGCNGSLAGTTYTTSAINANCTVTVTFTLNSYTVNATAQEGGSVSPSTATVDHGNTASFEITPSAGYGIDVVTGCGGSLSGTTYTTGPITAACTVIASFAADRYTVTAIAGEGGTITPSSTTVDQGQAASFTVTPDGGFLVDSVTGCGGSLDGDTYTTGPITAECQVAASFVAEPANFLAQLQGVYGGQMRSPKNIFFIDSTTLSVDIDGNTADITKDAFFGRTCQMAGELAGESYPVTGDGTFRCSDFSEGSWTAPKIVKVDDRTILATFSLDDGVAPYQIKFAGFGSPAPALYNPDQDYWLTAAPLADFSGAYDGQMTSADSCAGFSFSSTSAELSVQVDGDNVEMVRDSFFDGTCEFSGTRDSFIDGVMQASGTFRCSNFDEGTWTSERIVMADPDVLFANLRLSVPDRACSYTVRHIAFKMR